MEEGPKILTFEQFSYRKYNDSFPKYNNFYMFFADPKISVADIYTTKSPYVRFLKERPEMAKELCVKVQELISDNIDPNETGWRPIDRDLYQAYILMRGYGFSDRDLFT